MTESEKEIRQLKKRLEVIKTTLEKMFGTDPDQFCGCSYELSLVNYRRHGFLCGYHVIYWHIDKGLHISRESQMDLSERMAKKNGRYEKVNRVIRI